MERQKKPVHRVQMTDGKRNIIRKRQILRLPLNLTPLL
mgnify:FL=1